MLDFVLPCVAFAAVMGFILAALAFGDYDGHPVRIYCRNWKGESSWRHVVPHYVWHGSTRWHPKKQWLLRAYDLDKRALRDFAVDSIFTWVEC